MKWKLNLPENGLRKAKIHFAWWPTEVGDYTVWLENYQVTYEACRMEGGDPKMKYVFWKEVDRNILVTHPH